MRVLWLSGAIRPEFIGVLDGFMLTPNMGNAHPAGCVWAADSGLFSRKGARVFDLAAYLAWLAGKQPYQRECLFATAPDVVGDWAATWQRSAAVLPQLRALGYPAAVVGQDGLTRGDQLAWDLFDCFFAGGTDAWKLAETTYALAAEAKRRGKWVHMGRVNGDGAGRGGRFTAARLGGYDSADGTLLCYGADVNLRRLQAWQRRAAVQPPLWESA